MFDVDAALREVRSKTHDQIERETAYKWGSRAIACYILLRDEGYPGKRLDWFLKAEDFRHEALEHAAMAGDAGMTLREVEAEIERHRRG